jgi:hypothetical protein
VHKSGNPIRPIANWCNTPAYKAAKYFVKSLSKVISLPYAYNIKNTLQLINDLKEININPHTRLASFDISNMYTNIPTQDLKYIIPNILNHNISNTIEKQEY